MQSVAKRKAIITAALYTGIIASILFAQKMFLGEAKFNGDGTPYWFQIYMLDLGVLPFLGLIGMFHTFAYLLPSNIHKKALIYALILGLVVLGIFIFFIYLHIPEDPEVVMTYLGSAVVYVVSVIGIYMILICTKLIRSFFRKSGANK